jgi:multicomponent Na+:H+ antiporter subunit B
MAAAFILYGITFGLENAKKVLPTGLVRFLSALGVLIFAGVGVVTMILGAEFLNYNVLRHDPEHGQHLGILLVEIGVLVTVFGVMVTIFYMFAGRELPE